MRFGEMLDAVEKASYQAGEEAGLEVGDQGGVQRTLDLISCMEQDGKADQIPQLSKAPGFLEKMFEKYHLSSNPNEK